MVVKDKLLRVQGRRSRGGCLICKQRHIKCDEALPACAKCVGSNRTCQYADRTVASIPRFVLYTCPEDPHLSLQTSLRDRRALWHFHHRTLDQIEGPFKSELWSCIIPSLAQHDAVVRQSLLALSSFHEHYLNTDSTNLSALKIAETYHQNAQRQIINMKTPDRQFDSILCACIIFAACEGLRGNFATATKHAHAGMKMIAAQIQNDQRQDQVFRDSNENLFHIFLDLQAQVMEANDDNFEMECPLLEEQIGSIPGQFDEPSDALSHLQILTTRLLELYEKAGEYHETNTWIPSQVAPALQPTYEALRRDHDKWARAISFRSSQVTKHYDRRRHAGRLLVEIFAASLETELHVFLHGEASYDTLKEVNLPILDLIETYLELRRDAIPADTFAKRDSGPSSFSSSPEVIPALFELAIRTRLPQLHARAVGILHSSRWREGVWDSTSAANLAGQIVELKRKGAIEATRNHTGCKFLITDIIPLSEQKVLINFGFKKIQPGTFDSFWLETIDPEQGQVQSCILDIVTS